MALARRCILRRVGLGGVRRTVTFSGVTQARLYQLNITVPNGSSCDQPVVAAVSSVETPSGPIVTMK